MTGYFPFRKYRLARDLCLGYYRPAFSFQLENLQRLLCTIKEDSSEESTEMKQNISASLSEVC